MWILQSAARVGRVSIGPEHPSLFSCIRTLSYRDASTNPNQYEHIFALHTMAHLYPPHFSSCPYA